MDSRPFVWRAALLRAVVAVVALIVSHSPATASEFVLRDFDDSGSDFGYVFAGFEQSAVPESPELIRVSDPLDGWGGAGVANADLDLSGFSEGRLVLDLVPNAGNQIERFDLELIDQFTDGRTSRSGKWTFDISGLTPGVPARVVSQTTLAQPTSGIGDFASLDLADIKQWAVLGDFNSRDIPNTNFDISFDRIAVSSLVGPPPVYPGAEPGAPWRAVADARIEAHRKADLSVTVLDAAGNVVPGAIVDVEMMRHEFGFGSTMQARRLNSETPTANDAIYREKAAELFNLATLENGLKWQAWEGEFGNQFTPDVALAALDWLGQQDIERRGHTFLWPGAERVPDDVEALLAGGLTESEKQTVRARIADHLASIGGATEGQITAWDVVNEPRTQNDLMTALGGGDLEMVPWFQQARAVAPDADLYLNEFDILTSKGAITQANRDQLEATVEALRNAGAPVDGLGFQAHFRDGDLTGPEQIWAILDRFEELGLKMQVTEFDHETTNEALQAQYMRDFLTAIFAHEGVDDLLMWGFWEGVDDTILGRGHWRPDAALYRSDWSIKPNGQAYRDLVLDEWWTDEDLVADGDGTAELRGFKGEYRITVTDDDGRTRSLAVTLSDDGEQLVVRVPELLGDMDFDADLDADDLNALIAAAGSSDTLYDLDGDGAATFAFSQSGVASDSDYFLRVLVGSDYGDANLDGNVNALDTSLLLSGLRGQGSGWRYGDFNGDGRVNALDTSILISRLGYTPASLTVPEPTTGAMLAMAILATCVLRRGAGCGWLEHSMALALRLRRLASASLVVSVTLVSASTCRAGLVFDGIVEHACYTRTDLGNGLDAITITVDVGTSEFTVIDGGFTPLGGGSFNQVLVGGPSPAPDATPTSSEFFFDAVSAQDTTFLLGRDFGDPSVDGPNTDTVFELSTTSVGYETPLTGSFELARLVVPNGAGVSVAEVLGTINVGDITFAIDGAVVGTLSGAVAAVPEASTMLFWSAITGCLITSRLRGDYNRDGRVDAADYTVWRDSLGSTTDLDADGNGDLLVDEEDDRVWRDNYGDSAAETSLAVPEPSGLAALLPLCLGRFRQRRG